MATELKNYGNLAINLSLFILKLCNLRLHRTPFIEILRIFSHKKNVHLKFNVGKSHFEPDGYWISLHLSASMPNHMDIENYASLGSLIFHFGSNNVFDRSSLNGVWYTYVPTIYY